MGVFNKFKGLMGFDEYEDDELDMEEEEESSYERKTVETRQPLAPKQKSDTGNVVPMQSRTMKAFTNNFKLMVIEPKDFNECSKLVDSLKSRKPVIVNLEKLDPETAKKIFDFLNGAIYALNGNVQKVADKIFVFAPENVSIFADGDSKPYNFAGGSNKDINPWK